MECLETMRLSNQGSGKNLNRIRGNGVMKFTTAEAPYEKAGGKHSGSAVWCYNNAELTQLEKERLLKQQKLTDVA